MDDDRSKSIEKKLQTLEDKLDSIAGLIIVIASGIVCFAIVKSGEELGGIWKSLSGFVGFVGFFATMIYLITKYKEE